jgi:hypothetical protein
MVLGNKKKKFVRKTGAGSDTLAAQAYQQGPDEFEFEEEASIEGAALQDHLILLYGEPKIGKTTFASLLDGVYFLATEPGYKSLKVRKTRIRNWATFTQFVKKMEKSPKLVKTVGFWAIDTVDNLAKFCMQYVCGRMGIAHPTDEDWGKGWEAYRDEFTHWVLRLTSLSPGCMFISHEATKDVVYRGLTMPKCTPALPKTCYTVINNLVDIIIRMGYDIDVPGAKKKGKDKKKDKSELRCIMTKSSPFYDAGDRTGKLPGVFHFKTEQEVVDKLVESFE